MTSDSRPSGRTIFGAPLLPFLLITSLFFMWGLANNLTDTLLAAFRRILSMSDFETAWIQIAFYGSYFCLALPAAILIQRTSYKTGVLFGLGLYVAGALLFYPASIVMQYGFFLAALFVLAGGLAILETACNPYILSMGGVESATRRLNLAQSFNPIGSISGVVISQFFILSHLNLADADERAAMQAGELLAIQNAELNAVMGPYVAIGLGLLLLWIVIAQTRMPSDPPSGGDFRLLDSLSRLAANRRYLGGVAAQFFYVGAQICVWSFTIRYVMVELRLNEAEASNYYIAALVLFMLFRFLNTALMSRIRPPVLLAISSLLAVFCTLGVIFGSGLAGVISLVAISGFMSLMFPTIFGLASRGLGPDAKIGSSGLIMAIGGGAALPALQGWFSDLSGSIHLSFFVPLVCFLVVGLYGLYAAYRFGHER